MAQQVQHGDAVQVHYTGTLADGTVFDSSRGRDTLAFTLGQGQLIPGFEKAVLGLGVGESVTVQIDAAEAYGPHQAGMMVVVDRAQFPPDLPLEIGLQLQMQQPNGQSMVVTVTTITDQNVTLDANHPLAGKDLTFEIELVAID
jgi:peptidylprolyl isomerase